MSLAVGMRVILDPHIMTRTSSHEPNQLIHRAGPTLLPPSSSLPLCKATPRPQYHSPTFPLPNYLLISTTSRAIHILLSLFVFFLPWSVWTRIFSPEIQKDIIRALDLGNGQCVCMAVLVYAAHHFLPSNSQALLFRRKGTNDLCITAL